MRGRGRKKRTREKGEERLGWGSRECQWKLHILGLKGTLRPWSRGQTGRWEYYCLPTVLSPSLAKDIHVVIWPVKLWDLLLDPVWFIERRPALVSQEVLSKIFTNPFLHCDNQVWPQNVGWPTHSNLPQILPVLALKFPCLANLLDSGQTGMVGTEPEAWSAEFRCYAKWTEQIASCLKVEFPEWCAFWTV